jgi:hypothetical protein
MLLVAERNKSRGQIHRAHAIPPQLWRIMLRNEPVASNGRDAAQYSLGAHRDLETDQVGKAQISFNVPVGATSRTAHDQPGLATTADRPGQEGPSAVYSPLAACADFLLFLHLVGRRPRHHHLSRPRRIMLLRQLAS